MIHAYDKVYLEKARTTLARMLDFAVYDLKYDIEDFFDMFINSGLAAKFEKGDFQIIAGKSGVELAYDVAGISGEDKRDIKPRYPANRSEEYWTGWALAYFQWETGLSFGEIVKFIPIKDILALYNPYHEMDIRQFTDKMTELYKSAKPDTNLKLIRTKLNLTQKALSDISGVPVRTIQQYEQRQKNINKAQAEYLVALSQVLGCTVMDLMETVAPADKT